MVQPLVLRNLKYSFKKILTVKNFSPGGLLLPLTEGVLPPTYTKNIYYLNPSSLAKGKSEFTQWAGPFV